MDLTLEGNDEHQELRQRIEEQQLFGLPCNLTANSIAPLTVRLEIDMTPFLILDSEQYRWCGFQIGNIVGYSHRRGGFGFSGVVSVHFLP